MNFVCRNVCIYCTNIARIIINPFFKCIILEVVKVSSLIRCREFEENVKILNIQNIVFAMGVCTFEPDIYRNMQWLICFKLKKNIAIRIVVGIFADSMGSGSSIFNVGSN